MQNNLTTKEPLILATFKEDEKWEVKTQKKTYILNGLQAKGLRDATGKGMRGLVWFKDFAISIPYIISIDKIKNSQEVIDKKRVAYAKRFDMDHLI